MSIFTNTTKSPRLATCLRIGSVQDYQLFTTKRSLAMPLVVPGINSQDGASKTEEWTNKLVGKKIGDGASDSTTFARADLPKETRVIESGQMVTKDFKPDRLNVHLAKDGTVSHVDHQ